MFCTNCGKELSPEENFCTRCGHKAPVLASQSSDSIAAQKELTTAQSMMAAVNLPDLQAVYAHLDKAAKCQDQALLQQLTKLVPDRVPLLTIQTRQKLTTVQSIIVLFVLFLPIRPYKTLA